MRRTFLALASLVLAIVSVSTAASAADKWDLTVSPVFFYNGTTDAGAGPPKGEIPLYCPNGSAACPGTMPITNNLRVDYGIAYHFDRRWSLEYTHSNFDFSLGRITSIKPFSVLTGDIDDRTDTGKLNFAAGYGLSFDAYYFSHQRSNLAATNAFGGCYFNGISCPGNVSNPASINSNAYGLGAAYAFGPHQRFEPPMFKVNIDAQFYPRPIARTAQNCIPPGFPGANAPVCNAEGIPGYVSSQTTYPYELTMFPLANYQYAPRGFLPFIAYERTVVLWHAENSPEAFNSAIWGFVQVLGHGLSVSYTNFKLNGCYCSNTVPAPDSIRSDTNILKFTYDYKF